MQPINGVSAEQAPRRRPDWGFSSVAEANLFRIRGITGVADTEASNMQGWGEQKGRGERKEEGAQWMCWQGADCVLAGEWSFGDGLCLYLLIVQNLRAICGCLAHCTIYRTHLLYVHFHFGWFLKVPGIHTWIDFGVLSEIIKIKETLFSSLRFPDCLKRRHTLSDSSIQRGLLLWTSGPLNHYDGNLDD